MKIAKLTVLSSVVGLLTAIPAMAQNAAHVFMPSPVQQTGYDYDYYAAADEAAAKKAAPAPASEAAPAANAAPADAASSEEEENKCRWCMCGKLADPWTLPQPERLKERNIVISGWLDGGIYSNQYGARSNGPIGLRDVAGEFTADQVWLSVDRKTDTQGCGWDVGGHVDYLFGSDAPDTQCFGDRTFDYGWFTSNNKVYGTAMPQLYAEIAYNDVKVKAGHFYTPIGYEVVQAPMNFFYSHSYSHTFGEPFTHTGALASYQRNEKTTFYGGWVNGWDEGFDGADGGSMFLGGLSVNLTDKTTFAWYVSAGKLGNGTAFPGAASGDAYYNCIIVTHKVTDKLTYVFEHDLGTNYNVDTQTTVDNQWYEINNYLLYKLNDCWSVGGRLEWFQDPQGVRVTGGACPGNYYSATAGFNYKPHANVTIRPELRYDWYDAFAGAVALPYNNGTSSSQLAGGFDMVFTY